MNLDKTYDIIMNHKDVSEAGIIMISEMVEEYVDISTDDTKCLNVIKKYYDFIGISYSKEEDIVSDYRAGRNFLKRCLQS
jgi:hypothetical protein